MDEFVVRNATRKKSAGDICPDHTKRILRLLKDTDALAGYGSAKEDLFLLLEKNEVIDLESDRDRIDNITSYLQAWIITELPPTDSALSEPMNKIIDLMKQKGNVSIWIRRYLDPRPNETTFPCDTCTKHFKSAGSRKTHKEVIHRGRRPYQCTFPNCGRKFVTSNLRATHSAIHYPRRTFDCMTCPKRFKQQSTLHVHWKVCKNEEIYSCPTCSKNMSSQHNLTTHKKTHDDVEKEFECPDPNCTKRFAQNAALKRHEVVHSGERKFECEVCEKKFTYQFNLTEHMLTHMDKQKKFKCKEDKKECKRFFRRKQHLTRHISRTHTEVQCENCMEKMAGLHNLKLHNIRTHTPVQCGICKEECAGRDNLELHNKTHEKEKRLECPRCDKKFGKKHHLSRHIFNLHDPIMSTLGHTKGERFECRRCDKKFVRKHLLTKHIITHTEVECEKCTPLKKVCVHVVFGGYTGAA